MSSFRFGAESQSSGSVSGHRARMKDLKDVETLLRNKGNDHDHDERFMFIADLSACITDGYITFPPSFLQTLSTFFLTAIKDCAGDVSAIAIKTLPVFLAIAPADIVKDVVRALLTVVTTPEDTAKILSAPKNSDASSPGLIHAPSTHSLQTILLSIPAAAARNNATASSSSSSGAAAAGAGTQAATATASAATNIAALTLGGARVISGGSGSGSGAALGAEVADIVLDKLLRTLVSLSPAGDSKNIGGGHKSPLSAGASGDLDLYQDVKLASLSLLTLIFTRFGASLVASPVSQPLLARASDDLLLYLQSPEDAVRAAAAASLGALSPLLASQSLSALVGALCTKLHSKAGARSGAAAGTARCGHEVAAATAAVVAIAAAAQSQSLAQSQVQLAAFVPQLVSALLSQLPQAPSFSAATLSVAKAAAGAGGDGDEVVAVAAAARAAATAAAAAAAPAGVEKGESEWMGYCHALDALAALLAITTNPNNNSNSGNASLSACADADFAMGHDNEGDLVSKIVDTALPMLLVDPLFSYPTDSQSGGGGGACNAMTDSDGHGTAPAATAAAATAARLTDEEAAFLADVDANDWGGGFDYSVYNDNDDGGSGYATAAGTSDFDTAAAVSAPIAMTEVSPSVSVAAPSAFVPATASPAGASVGVVPGSYSGTSCVHAF